MRWFEVVNADKRGDFQRPSHYEGSLGRQRRELVDESSQRVGHQATDQLLVVIIHDSVHNERVALG